jgi:small conductance mechanosensitive channel
MRQVFVLRFQAILVTGLVSVMSVLALPVLAQEGEAEGEEPQSVLVESTFLGDVQPENAVTVSDVAIPVDQLSLILKPMTLEELQVEAAAWFLLLKAKVTAISESEVAIKRKNLVIQQEEEAATLVEEAKTKLADAESQLAAAEQGTPEYDDATKQVEEAKEALLTANQAVEKVVKENQQLDEDDTLNAVVEEAESEKEIVTARRVLEEARASRDELEAGSAAYQGATTQIDTLNKAILDLDTLREDFQAAVPDTPEHQELVQSIEQARATVTEASDALIEAGLAPVEAEDAATTQTQESGELLDDVAANVDGAAQNSGATGEGAATEPEATTESEATTPEEDAAEVGDAADQLADVNAMLADMIEAETELKNQLIVNVTTLQGEQTAIVDRLTTTLEALEAKGGDATSYRKYIEAVSGVELDVTDTEGLGVRVLTWIKSDEGGVRLGWSLGQFVGILGIAFLVAPVAGVITKKSLGSISSASVMLQDFVVLVVKRGVVVIGALVAVTSLGVSLGPLLALLGGVSFVLAFALQSNLGNFASGLMLMVYKPFDVGDHVEIPGTSDKGFVRKITLANTSFDHYNGKIVTLPNSVVWGSRLENLLPTENRLIELLFMIGSDADARQLKDIWDQTIENNPKIVKDEWHMSMPYLSASSGSLMYWCGAWAKKDGYWAVYEEVLMAMWDGLNEAGISFGINKGESYVHLVNSQVDEHGIKIAEPTHSPHVKHNATSKSSLSASSAVIEPDAGDAGIG